MPKDLSQREIQQMFGLSELKQTRVYQEALAEGFEQGRLDGELAVVLRQITRRLGTVELKLLSHIQQLSRAQIEELAVIAVGFLHSI
jgi:predicted transposase YdaD